MKFTCYEVTHANATRPTDAQKMQRALNGIKDQLLLTGQHSSLGENNIHRLEKFELRSWANQEQKSYSFLYEDFIYAQILEGPYRSQIKIVDKSAIHKINQILNRTASTHQSMLN